MSYHDHETTGSGWQHFELMPITEGSKTGWACVGCGAHLETDERGGKTYGRVAHDSGCTELTIMLGQPREQLSGIGRIGVLERRADQAEAALGTADDVLKGLGIQVEGLRADLIRLGDHVRERLDSLVTLHNGVVTSTAETAAMLAERDDGLDNRLTELEVEYRRPGGAHERLRELEKAVLNPRGTVVDQFADVTARLARLELAVGGLVEHGPAGHALPRPASPASAVSVASPPRPSVQLTEWVVRIAADEDWTEAHLRNAIGDLPGLTVHQMSFIGAVTMAGGGQGTADAAGAPGSVRITGSGR